MLRFVLLILLALAARAEASSRLAPASFASLVEPLDAATRADMTGRSWRPGCPVGLDALSLVRVSHWGFDGALHEGELVVATSVAKDVVRAFRGLFDARFPIERMVRVDAYGGSDAASMAANNTSAFNCRPIAGTKRWSLHSYGTAIDINPRQNPWVKGEVFDPPEGAAFARRDDVRPGMLVRGDKATAAFESIGWGWGGRWKAYKDYMHVSRDGW